MDRIEVVMNIENRINKKNFKTNKIIDLVIEKFTNKLIKMTPEEILEWREFQIKRKMKWK